MPSSTLLPIHLINMWRTPRNHCQKTKQTPIEVMLPYTVRISEDIRRVCRRYGMKVAFKSGRSLCLVLTKVKDLLPIEKQSKVVYRIPCSCDKAYIGQTRRRFETWLKEQQKLCQKGTLEMSVVVEHAW